MSADVLADPQRVRPVLERLDKERIGHAEDHARRRLCESRAGTRTAKCFSAVRCTAAQSARRHRVPYPRLVDKRLKVRVVDGKVRAEIAVVRDLQPKAPRTRACRPSLVRMHSQGRAWGERRGAVPG